MKEDRKKWRESREGACLLRTNLQAESAEELWSKYMQLTEAESSFRALKSAWSIRPLFHQLEPRVKAHVMVAFLGYATDVAILIWEERLKCGSLFVWHSSARVLTLMQEGRADLFNLPDGPALEHLTFFANECRRVPQQYPDVVVSGLLANDRGDDTSDAA
jgi:hypothetical protein